MHWSNKWNPNFMEFVEVKEATRDAAGNKVWSQRMYETVSKDKYAIGWGGLMHIKGTCVNPDGTKCPGYPDLRVLAVSRTPDGPAIPLTADNIKNHSYPLTRDAYIYLDKAPGRALDPKVREFMRFVLSREGQQIVADSRIFIPLDKAQLEAELRKLDGDTQ